MITRTSLRHPRVQWEIEAAMWRAVEQSYEYGSGISYVKDADGLNYIVVFHRRNKVPAFSFQMLDRHVYYDRTSQVIAALRANAKEAV